MNEHAFGPYHDGAADVFGDPLALDRAVRRACRCDPNELVELMHAQDPARAAEAEERLVGAVREAFGMAPFDRATGQGAADECCLEVWNAFCEFSKKKRTASATSPTSAPSGSPASPSNGSNATPGSASPCPCT